MNKQNLLLKRINITGLDELILITIFISLIITIIGVIFALILQKINWKELFIKTRIIWILTHYEKTRKDVKKEAKCAWGLKSLLEKGKSKLRKKGFSYYHSDTNIEDKNFRFHLGKGSFLFRRLF